MNAFEEYKDVTYRIISLSKKVNDSVSLAKAYGYLGDYYSKQFVSDSAYIFYNKAENFYKKLNDVDKLAKTKLNKSVLQLNEKDFIGSEKSALNALRILRKSTNEGLRFDANNLLGVIYNELSEYEKSIFHHNSALHILEQHKTEAYGFESTSLNNIGVSYHNKGDNKTAIKYFKKALSEPLLFIKNPEAYAFLTNNLGYSEFKLHNYKNLPTRFLKTLKISDSLNLFTSIISSKLHLSEYYALKNDTSAAINYSKQAYELAKEKKLTREILQSLKDLSIIDLRESSIYSKEYIKINDSLQLAERQVRNKLARIEYETEELTLEKDKLVEQRKTLIYIALSIILIGVLIFVIRFQIAKNRELRLIQEQQKANEEIYQLMINQQNKVEEVRQAEKKRIAQELHDGVLGKLFGTRINLGVLNQRDDPDAKTERVVYIDELKTLEQEIREISHDLNSEKSAVFNNFVVMVTNFFETQKTVCKAGISVSIDPQIEWNKVENMVKINFYRILQEAFQNINKHADAKNVWVTFQQTDSELQLEIKDDGVGFVYARKRKGIGLQNMLSRITSSNGTMQVKTEPGKGTLLEFRVAYS